MAGSDENPSKSGKSDSDDGESSPAAKAKADKNSSKDSATATGAADDAPPDKAAKDKAAKDKAAKDKAAKDDSPADDSLAATLKADEDDYDDDEEESFKSQADDPTDVWDEDALRAAGIELPSKPKAKPKSRRDDDVSDSIQVSDSLRSPRTAAPPPRSGLSWPMTLGVAAVLGVAVYFLVRFLR